MEKITQKFLSKIKAYKPENCPFLKLDSSLSLVDRKLCRAFWEKDEQELHQLISPYSKRQIKTILDDLEFEFDQYDFLETYLTEGFDSLMSHVDYLELLSVEHIPYYCGGLMVGNFQDLALIEEVLAVKELYLHCVENDCSSVIFHDIYNCRLMPFLKSLAQYKQEHENPNSGNTVITYIWYLPSAKIYL